MTASEERPTGPTRPRSLQQDLLEDLRRTTPMADPRPGAHAARARRTPTEAAERALPVEVQVTPTRWRAPSVRQASGRPGVVLSAGPLRVSLDLFGR